MNTHSYYIIPIIEAYKALPPETDDAKRMAQLLSVNIGDQDTLLSILDPLHRKAHGTDIAGDQSETCPSDSVQNMETIDTFLNQFGTNIPAAGYLAQAGLDRPLQTPKNETGDEISLLKNLIKLHRYEEALKLIEAQNLNNPQKSIYFALQMRFIKKLMAIENYKNQQKG